MKKSVFVFLLLLIPAFIFINKENCTEVTTHYVKAQQFASIGYYNQAEEWAQKTYNNVFDKYIHSIKNSSDCQALHRLALAKASNFLGLILSLQNNEKAIHYTKMAIFLNPENETYNAAEKTVMVLLANDD